jgi:MtfA peptidase
MTITFVRPSSGLEWSTNYIPLSYLLRKSCCQENNRSEYKTPQHIHPARSILIRPSLAIACRFTAIFYIYKMVIWITIIASVAVLSYLMARWTKSQSAKEGENKPIDFPASWKVILEQRVLFYHNLSPGEKRRFEMDVSRFLKRVTITGVQTEVDITDKLLVASSAAIPVFGFPDWDYTFLDEVMLYPGSFDTKFKINSRDEVITGMVGNGAMEGKMILSKPSLHRGFDNATDKQNVGVHEFIHLLDKEDGDVDGIPATLLNKQFSIPWLQLIREKTAAIQRGEKDINPYGATHEREFFAVAGEYFFERPQLLKENHPDLYALLAKAFNQDTAGLLKISKISRAEIERNDPCPCGSGAKFKKCCMNK